MRDPKRIDRILNLIKKIWKKYPDTRLCQLIYVSLGFNELGLFYREDDILEQKLED